MTFALNYALQLTCPLGEAFPHTQARSAQLSVRLDGFMSPQTLRGWTIN